MGATRRTQFLMEPEEFRRLKAEARRRRTSVGELIRAAVRKAYFSEEVDRAAIVSEILHMGLPALGWNRAKKDLESRYDDLS
jgi:hypothetical protein